LAEWLVEQGIAEDRAIRLEGARIAEARIDWHGKARPGLVEDAVLVSRAAGTPRGTLRLSTGEPALIDHLPPSAREGAAIRVQVTRAGLAEERRGKWAQARPTQLAPHPAPGLAEALRAEGHAVRAVRRFPDCDWHDLAGEAMTPQIEGPGFALGISPTPAMTLIDVDGWLGPRALALACVPAIAAAIQRFGLGGSIGIDFPTLASKADRRAVDEALEAALAGWPHERTAMNGFGFVQLVARLERPSLLHLFRYHRREAILHLLLRRAEGLDGAGATLLGINGSLAPCLREDWIAELQRRTGRPVRVAIDDGLALDAPHAQVVPR